MRININTLTKDDAQNFLIKYYSDNNFKDMFFKLYGRRNSIFSKIVQKAGFTTTDQITDRIRRFKWSVEDAVRVPLNTKNTNYANAISKEIDEFYKTINSLNNKVDNSVIFELYSKFEKYINSKIAFKKFLDSINNINNIK